MNAVPNEQLILDIYKATTDPSLWPEIGNSVFSHLNNLQNLQNPQKIIIVPPIRNASQLIAALHRRVTEQRLGDDSSNREYQLIKILIPHLTRAQKISNTLSAAIQLTEITMTSMDQLTLACGLISTHDKLIQYNSLFAELIESGVIIITPSDSIKLSTPEADRKMQQFITNNQHRSSHHHSGANDLHLRATANQTNVRQLTANQVTGTQNVTVDTGAPDDMCCFRYTTIRGHDLVLHYLPHAKREQYPPETGSEKVLGIVFLQNLNDLQLPSESVLETLWNFTNGEVSVLHLLLQGYSTIESATILNTSANAVRFHFKSMFRKTGTNKQAELMGLTMGSLGRFDWSKNAFDQSELDAQQREIY